VVNSVWFCGVAGRDYFYFLMIDNPYSLVVVLEVMGFDFQKYLDIFLEAGCLRLDDFLAMDSKGRT
jgi:hypothetical protein